jgi:hypothetical protein
MRHAQPQCNPTCDRIMLIRQEDTKHDVAASTSLSDRSAPAQRDRRSWQLEKLAASLRARSVVGDGLDLHHMPQAALGLTSREEGGVLAMTADEHALTRTYRARGVATKKAETGMSFRDVLVRDIGDVRRLVGPKYNAGLLGLLRYYRERFPSLMKR